MYILTIRTDKPGAEVGLYNDDQRVAYHTWQAHRELAETLNKKIIAVLMEGNVRLHELQGIAVYKGPGSFTGLRIGLTVANALAYSLELPSVARTGQDWLEVAIKDLLDGENERIVVPEYGAEPHITEPKH